MKNLGLSLLVAAFASLSVSAAQTPEEIERYKKMTILSVGAAMVLNDEPYAGFNDGEMRRLVVPFFAYNKNNLTVAGPNISYRFWRPGGVQLSAETRYRFQNYDSDDSPYLEGMDNRDGTLELGLQGQKRWNRLRVQGRGFVDVAGQHDGYELQARATFEVSDGRALSFRPAVGVSYQSQNVTNHYFGVRANEARNDIDVGGGELFDRAAYFPDSAWVPTVGAEFRLRMSRRIQLGGQVRTDFFPDEIADSPIVDSDTRFSAFMGLSYLLSGPGVEKGRWL
ncbi:MAG: MipA/OmpV family protein [Parvularculaceae bacterium]|nr:MipA/OmpV family protein [Parvularculaceae bacterium]